MHGGATAMRTPDRGKRLDPGEQAHPKGGRFITRFLALNGQEKVDGHNTLFPAPCPYYNPPLLRPFGLTTISCYVIAGLRHRHQRYPLLTTLLVFMAQRAPGSVDIPFT